MQASNNLRRKIGLVLYKQHKVARARAAKTRHSIPSYSALADKLLQLWK